MPNLLTTSQAATFLGTSVATLRRWASAGLLPTERTAGGHRRFRRSDLEHHAGRERLGDPVARWVDLLASLDTQLGIQAALLRDRLALGSWWAVGASLSPVVHELQRRRERGAITALQRLQGLERLRRGLVPFLDWSAAARGGPTLLLISRPGDPIVLPLALVELGAAESGWSSRWAAQCSPADLAEDLGREPADALIACAGAADPGAAARYAQELGTVARSAQMPLGLLGAWPEPAPGTLLKDHLQAGAWLARMAAR